MPMSNDERPVDEYNVRSKATDGDDAPGPSVSKAEKKRRASDEAIHTITFGGVYAANNEGGPVQKGYTITLKLKHASINRESNSSAKSVFKHALADKYMPRKYPDFIRLITYHILNVDSTHPQVVAKTIELLQRPGLIEYIDVEELDIDADLYPTDDKLRKAIRQCEKDPKGYEAVEKHLRSVHGMTLKHRAESLELNDNFDPNDDAYIPDEQRSAIPPAGSKNDVFAKIDEGVPTPDPKAKTAGLQPAASTALPTPPTQATKDAKPGDKAKLDSLG